MFHIDYIGVYILLLTDIHVVLPYNTYTIYKYIYLFWSFFYCMGFSIIFNTANNSFILLSKSKKLEGFNGIGLLFVSDGFKNQPEFWESSTTWAKIIISTILLNLFIELIPGTRKTITNDMHIFFCKSSKIVAKEGFY